MKIDTTEAEYAEMAKEAAAIDAACADKKPERLPRHELALFLMDKKFTAKQVLTAFSLVAIFAILEFAFAL